MNFMEFDKTREYFVEVTSIGKVEFKESTPKEIRQKYGYLKWDYHPDTIRGYINSSIDVFSCSVYKSVKEDMSLSPEIKSLFTNWRLGVWKSFRDTGIKLLDNTDSVTLIETKDKISIQVDRSLKLFLSRDGSFGYVTRNFFNEKYRVYSFSILSDLYTILSNFSDYVLNGTEFGWILNSESSELFDFKYEFN